MAAHIVCPFCNTLTDAKKHDKVIARFINATAELTNARDGVAGDPTTLLEVLYSHQAALRHKSHQFNEMAAQPIDKRRVIA